MGQLVSGSIPNLISGVSQQPSNVRLPTQAEEQVNCYSSVSDFLKRRPALNHIAKIADSEVSKSFDDGSIFIHSINRDEVEKYIVLVTTDDVRVFDLQGNEKTVNIDESAKAYLAQATDPAAPGCCRHHPGRRRASARPGHPLRRRPAPTPSIPLPETRRRRASRRRCAAASLRPQGPPSRRSSGPPARRRVRQGARTGGRRG